MKAYKLLFVILSFLPLLSSCAFDLIHVKQVPASLQAAPPDGRNSLELQQETKLSLPTGYSRVLKKGTKWQFVGTVAQGDVYRTGDQVLTLEASNIHEAYIVVSSGRLVGFYLPVERSFSAIDPVMLPMREISNN